MDVQHTNVNLIKTSDNNEQQIRQLLSEFREAAMARDIDKVMSFYSPEVIAFDIVPPLQFKGREAYRKSWEEAFNSCKDDPANINETIELRVTVNDDLAFCHAINHNVMVSNEGKKMEMWMRSTHCLQKINDKWLITHEQFSVPVDFENQKPLFDLKPETNLH